MIQNKDEYSTNNRTFEILSKGYNLVETHQSVSSHAEMIALSRASLVQNNWRPYNTTLYTTLEPCPMCLSAILTSRVQSLVYGARDIRLGAIVSYMNMLDDYVHPYYNGLHVVGGVCDVECGSMITDFFREQ